MEQAAEKSRWLTIGRERAIVVLIIGLGLLIGVRFFVNDPRAGTMALHLPSGQEISLPTCIFNDGTGLPCMICGLTRSTAYMTRGHIVRSWRENPLGPFVVLGAVYGVLWAIWTLITGGTRPESDKVDAAVRSRRISIWAIYILAVVWIINLARHWEWIRW